MVFVGTFIAYTIFLRLVRDWGAPRAGLYSFVSPVVALILGAIVLGEPLDLARDRRARRSCCAPPRSRSCRAAETAA